MARSGMPGAPPFFPRQGCVLKIFVLRELPLGQQPGSVVEEIDAAAKIWISIGAAREATENEIAAVKPSRRGSYRRRDMQAQPTA
jgi:hypothetical protein